MSPTQLPNITPRFVTVTLKLDDVTAGFVNVALKLDDVTARIVNVALKLGDVTARIVNVALKLDDVTVGFVNDALKLDDITARFVSVALKLGDIIARFVNVALKLDDVTPRFFGVELDQHICLTHKWNESYLALLASLRASLHFAWYSFPIPLGVGGLIGLDGWLHELSPSQYSLRSMWSILVDVHKTAQHCHNKAISPDVFY